MALTRDELQGAGATPELAALLVRESRRVDITWNPMAVGLVLAFLGAMGWLVVSQAGVQADVAVLKRDMAEVREEVAGIKQEIVEIRQLLEGRN